MEPATSHGRADPPGIWGGAGHAAVTGVLVGVGAFGASAAGAPGPEVWSGAGLAWAIQAPAVWRLMVALGDGRSATRPWVAGMAARLGGLGLVAALAWSTPLAGDATALAYVATVIPLLWLEGPWLNRVAGAAERADRPDGSTPEERSGGTTTDEPADGR